MLYKKMITKRDLEILNLLVGNINEKNAVAMKKNVEMYLDERVSVFRPLVVQCPYALRKNHTHISYSFVLCFQPDMNMVVEAHSELLCLLRCIMLEISRGWQEDTVGALSLLIANVLDRSMSDKKDNIVPFYERMEVDNSIRFMGNHLSEKITRIKEYCFNTKRIKYELIED